MERREALKLARERHRALMRAWMAHWKGEGPEPVEAEYGYRHGWMMVEGHHFAPDEIYPPAEYATYEGH